jgi:hypothetical protein
VKRLALLVIPLVLVSCGRQPGGPVELAPVGETGVVEERRLPDTLPETLVLPHEREGRRSGSGGLLYDGVCRS